MMGKGSVFWLRCFAIFAALTSVVAFWAEPSPASHEPGHDTVIRFDELFGADQAEKQVFDLYKKKGLQELYELKAARNPCIRAACGPVAISRAKEILDIAIDAAKAKNEQVQNERTQSEGFVSRTLAGGSLLVSFLSLGVSFFSFRQKSREAKATDDSSLKT